MSASDVDDFLRKVVTGECYVDPKVYDDPYKIARIKALTTTLFTYRMEKMVSAAPSPQTVQNTLSAIAIAMLEGTVRTREREKENEKEQEHGNPSSKQPNPTDEDIMLGILKFGAGPAYNIQVNVGDVTSNIVKNLDEVKNIPQEKKLWFTKFTGFLKEHYPKLALLFAELFTKYVNRT